MFLFAFFSVFFVFAEEKLALDEIQRRLKEDPENKEALTQLALHFTVEKDYMKAVDTYFRLIKVDPQNFHAYNNLGILYKKVGQYKDSVFCYQKALQIKPDYYLVHYNIGLAYESMGRMQEAREAYGRALSLNPDFVQALERLRELSDDPAAMARLPEPQSGQILVADSPNALPKTISGGSAATSPSGQVPSTPTRTAPPKAEALDDVPEPKSAKEGKGTKGASKGSNMIRTLRTTPGAPFYTRAMDALEKDDLKTAIEQYVTCVLQDREFLSEPDNGLIQKALQLLRDRPNSMSDGLFYRGFLSYISSNQEGALADLKTYVEENKKAPFRSQAEHMVLKMEERLAAARQKETVAQVEQRLATAPEIVSNATFTPRPDDSEIKKMSVEEIIEEGKRLSREGRLRDAIATLKTGLDKERENVPLLLATANIYTDLMLLQGDQEAGKMARDIFEKVLSLVPGSSREADLSKNMIKELSSRIH